MIANETTLHKRPNDTEINNYRYNKMNEKQLCNTATNDNH